VFFSKEAGGGDDLAAVLRLFVFLFFFFLFFFFFFFSVPSCMSGGASRFFERTAVEAASGASPELVGMAIPVPFFLASLSLSPSRSIVAAAYTSAKARRSAGATVECRHDGARRRRTTGCAAAAKRKGRGGTGATGEE